MHPMILWEGHRDLEGDVSDSGKGRGTSDGHTSWQVCAPGRSASRRLRDSRGGGPCGASALSPVSLSGPERIPQIFQSITETLYDTERSSEKGMGDKFKWGLNAFKSQRQITWQKCFIWSEGVCLTVWNDFDRQNLNLLLNKEVKLIFKHKYCKTRQKY